MQDVNVNGVKASPMVFPHTTNKETLRQRNYIHENERFHTDIIDTCYMTYISIRYI